MSGHRTLLKSSDPEVFSALIGEERRQHDGLELIPSENYTYPEVYCAYGTAFANKYSEGYPGRRYYGGQEFTDQIENLAIDRAKTLFRCEHANVQPLSGSPMNQAAYMAFLSPGDTILAMDLSHGGHLTHGAPVSHMGKIFDFVRYKTDPANGEIDFDVVTTTTHKTLRDPRAGVILCKREHGKRIDQSVFPARRMGWPSTAFGRSPACAGRRPTGGARVMPAVPRAWRSLIISRRYATPL
jgi:glycine hydroxymethyltransferase